MIRAAAAFCFLLVLGLPAAAAERVDYLRDVKPILKERCFACHGALKQESKLRLDTAASIRRGGNEGPAVEPGKAADSLLIYKVSAKDEAERMPPEGKPLTAGQIAMLKAWINQGAVAPKDEQPEEDPNKHWAFQLPQRSPIPQVKSPQWRGNPIDAFIAAAHERRGLKPVALVDKPRLLRRVYLDLIGLPPTRKELHAFLNDSRPDAYQRVVKRLLDSPHYGERWGRHWMDVWRYTDWYGLGQQLRNSQKHIWHWRDWIIESLNADRGYDRMVVEMLAADEIAPTDRRTLRATGFLARNYYLFNRTTWLDDTIEHTSKAFLGLTMNCTKCHDHKYDPLTQVDYYRLRAIFEPHQVRLDTVPGQTDLEKDGLPRVFDAHPDAPTYLFIRGDAKRPDKSRVLTPGVPGVLAPGELKIAAVDLPPQAHSPALRAFVLEDHLRLAEKQIETAYAALGKARQQLAAAEKAATRYKGKKSEGKTFLKDDFSKPQPDVWDTGPGEWDYADGRLVQSRTGTERAYLRSKKEHPRDFEATLKFKTTGGQMWKSVGLSFDVVDSREKLVYLSAVSPGSKLQVSYKIGANHVYPTDGKQDRPVKLNEDYELTLRVRGPLVNVAINGQHALAYQLPVKREAGRIDLVAFDAAVEFDSLEIRDLPSEVQLVPAGNKAAPVTSVAAARAAVHVAEKVLAAARLFPETLRTAHAADVARHQSPPAATSKELIAKAALAARRHELAKAEEAMARAEGKPAKALKAAEAKLEQARRALKQPGEKYTSLRASLKALEGPAETAASRMKPYPKTSTGRRTALARWIANRQNPLTARVAVNHLWLRHFGQPLVDPVTDFGRRTKRPPLHELLDWLAVEFMENGWSMKHLHRLIVTSRAYQLSTSTADADAATRAADPDNHFHWRRKPARMESQVIRDSLLHLAGVLDPKLGGPTIDPKKADTAYRRSLYFTQSRDDQHKFLSMFDDADILRCYRRSESIVPQQALALSNSKLSLEMARKIAARIEGGGEKERERGGGGVKWFVEAAFELVLGRPAEEIELVECLRALRETEELLQGRRVPDARRRARANLVHALLNHNDFVTIR